jgi:hypothetical protein
MFLCLSVCWFKLRPNVAHASQLPSSAPMFLLAIYWGFLSHVLWFVGVGRTIHRYRNQRQRKYVHRNGFLSGGGESTSKPERLADIDCKSLGTRAGRTALPRLRVSRSEGDGNCSSAVSTSCCFLAGCFVLPCCFLLVVASLLATLLFFY